MGSTTFRANRPLGQLECGPDPRSEQNRADRRWRAGPPQKVAGTGARAALGVVCEDQAVGTCIAPTNDTPHQGEKG